ncbi:acyltransferase [Candidatus Sororendozoicomonas aggregata]|uniref:acyltransferase n=1 Tax=Candidatus Sororendozoicomonas aggregata TaxID=3073239 RepID=UPI002ED11BF9
MLSFLPSTLKGLIAASLLILNTLLLSIPLLVCALLKLIVPVPSFRLAMGKAANQIAELWITINSGWMKLTQAMNLRVEGLEVLNPKGWYLITANHRSWADITIMQHVLNKKAPFMKFFIKQELIWLPVAGLCWWAMDFPFMKRYSKAYLAKHPEKKGKDLETTRQACAKFKDIPISIVNFLEGTRFTDGKHQKQCSPYRTLLKPKAGGIGHVLSAMGDQLNSMLNLTLYYDHNALSFWDFLCGRISSVHIHIEKKKIPAEFIGKDYQGDADFRQAFQQWVNQLWEEKDKRLLMMEKQAQAEKASKVGLYQ